jgi:ATP-dependent RNA helicase SUPV3L1/SUV3
VGEAAAAEAGDRPGSGKPRGKRPPKGGKGNKGPKHQHPRGEKPAREGARTYEARPPRKSDRIDPDNPFAAALMGLRDKT